LVCIVVEILSKIVVRGGFAAAGITLTRTASTKELHHRGHRGHGDVLSGDASVRTRPATPAGRRSTDTAETQSDRNHERLAFLPCRTSVPPQSGGVRTLVLCGSVAKLFAIFVIFVAS
jgi:hypothetical protein